jgi:two-component system, OmpR family, sensor histidine kinase BaeS
MLTLSMRHGFSLYLVQGELNRFNDLALALAEIHDPENPGWPEFAAQPQHWRRFVGEHFQPTGLSRKDAIKLGLPPPGRGDPLQIGTRISLLDAMGRPVVDGRDKSSIFVKRPIYATGSGPSSKPIGWIGLYAPRGARDATDSVFLTGQYWSLFLAGLLAMGLSTVAAFVLARQFLQPFKALEAGARTLASGNYSARIANTRRDELGSLIDHYNALAEDLEAAEAAERRWISDTSHELQTPLAVLQASIEAVQDGVHVPNEKTLAEMHGAVLRLSRLVSDLKTLSFTREADFLTTKHPADLGEIVEDAIDSIKTRGEHAGLTLCSHLDKPLTIDCDHQRIRQVFDNLLENALRYTDAPGSITVRAFRDRNNAIVTVDDTAPSPPADALPHLFNRFYRAEESRSRKHGGSGLGLSICEAIVTAHGGSIKASQSQCGGLTLTVAFPLRGS